jgi:hypothetical protein
MLPPVDDKVPDVVKLPVTFMLFPASTGAALVAVKLPPTIIPPPVDDTLPAAVNLPVTLMPPLADKDASADKSPPTLMLPLAASTGALLVAVKLPSTIIPPPVDDTLPAAVKSPPTLMLPPADAVAFTVKLPLALMPPALA